MPDSTTVTSGWFQTHRTPYSALLRSMPEGSPYLIDGGHRPGERAAPQRLHDHDAHPLRRRVLQAFRAGLVFLVQVVVLDLAERPVIAVYDGLEGIRFVVERKAGVPDPAVGQGVVEEPGHVHLLHDVPAVPGEPVDQVIVDVIGLQFLQLLVQVSVHALPLLDEPGRQLRRQADLFAVAGLAALCPRRSRSRRCGKDKSYRHS
jgi:hypothetical protein